MRELALVGLGAAFVVALFFLDPIIVAIGALVGVVLISASID